MKERSKNFYRSIKIHDILPSEVLENPNKYNSSLHAASELSIVKKHPVFEPTCYGPWMKTIAESAGYNWQNVHTLVLTNTFAKTLIRASDSALLTGRVPASELEDLLDQFPLNENVIPPEQGWFIRLDFLSPKDGIGGTNPVYTPKEILT